MSDAMVDLETMGTGPNSRILSLGAVMFDYRGIEKEFYHKITKKSCDKLGLEEDESTKQWWAKQSAEAREVLSPFDAFPIKDVLHEFQVWVDNPKQTKIWGCGSDFDNVILLNAYQKSGWVAPWMFWNNRCYRTVKSLFPHVPMKREGTYHNALDDARSQALHLIEIHKSSELGFLL